jgi:hypothetical protein
MKNIFYSILILFVLTISCGEGAAKKVNQDNVNATEAKSQQNISNSPVMKFDKQSHDFGNINEGDIVTTTFSFTNAGKSDLIIVDARGSCGCTVPQYPKNQPIAPGASGEIVVSFDSNNKPNLQQKAVTISANTENGREMLRIKAMVSPDPIKEQQRQAQAKARQTQN